MGRTLTEADPTAEVIWIDPQPVLPGDRLYERKEFMQLCDQAEFNDFAGYFVPALNGVKDQGRALPPSCCASMRLWATHVVWCPFPAGTPLITLTFE